MIEVTESPTSRRPLAQPFPRAILTLVARGWRDEKAKRWASDPGDGAGTRKVLKKAVEGFGHHILSPFSSTRSNETMSAWSRRAVRIER
jgi:hypothetical protein